MLLIFEIKKKLKRKTHAEQYGQKKSLQNERFCKVLRLNKKK